eukprot:CAMPEP_0178772090 /NCGR_PEP_ID=MMETSP0744-20121128/22345_1 /TAXON_ID=913974 /ORGANISM="Nitzschia punctata, Strain CCMP561" /LENGTH=59 /DNA_ID=CAMNT_0020428721 /DNA_START=85 /DNA_END=260 /DNA_ORIENTATION=+
MVMYFLDGEQKYSPSSNTPLGVKMTPSFGVAPSWSQGWASGAEVGSLSSSSTGDKAVCS